MQTETIASSHYTKALQARMRAAREAVGLTQKDMAGVLGISKDAYEKYETRSRLPHHLIEPFAVETGLSVSELIAGRDIPRRGTAEIEDAVPRLRRVP
jgi:transcriptional regulator with XRE-family HTH domain